MPTYEYRCRDCGHSFDIVQKMSDEQLTHCPECGGDLRKVFSPPAISFRGAGFYATDHRQKATSSTDGKDSDGKDGKDRKDGKDTKDTGEKKEPSKTSSEPKSDSKTSDASTSNATKKDGSS
jgi:putative FmdB family regulatory protein